MAEEFREEKTEDLLSTPTTPLDRPVREKNPVKTFDPSTIRDSPREFIIEQGKGTQLKNIPSVAYKLSKLTRGDEMLAIIHNLLYGRRGKAHHFKRNVLQVSGFVWGEEEENKLKGKLKLKDKLEKMKKNDLWRVCDVIERPDMRARTNPDILWLRWSHYR
ncbi:hypothetical protein SUGI_0110880 [Cryptomeria japonica]|nr:hypothetical protein SUGI_0110880 [Cryptomeria japonica]